MLCIARGKTERLAIDFANFTGVADDERITLALDRIRSIALRSKSAPCRSSRDAREPFAELRAIDEMFAPSDTSPHHRFAFARNALPKAVIREIVTPSRIDLACRTFTDTIRRATQHFTGADQTEVTAAGFLPVIRRLVRAERGPFAIKWPCVPTRIGVDIRIARGPRRAAPFPMIFIITCKPQTAAVEPRVDVVVYIVGVVEIIVTVFDSRVTHAFRVPHVVDFDVHRGRTIDLLNKTQTFTQCFTTIGLVFEAIGSLEQRMGRLIAQLLKIGGLDGRVDHRPEEVQVTEAAVDDDGRVYDTIGIFGAG